MAEAAKFHGILSSGIPTSSDRCRVLITTPSSIVVVCFVAALSNAKYSALCFWIAGVDPFAGGSKESALFKALIASLCVLKLPCHSRTAC